MKSLGRTIFKLAILSGLISNCNLIYAQQHTKEVIPYLGVDYKIRYTEGADYWKKIIPTNKIYQNISLFSGFNLHKHLSTEVGYSTSLKISKYTDISNGSMWGGDVAPNNYNQDVQLRYKSWHMDLNIICPNEKTLALLAIFGAAYTKPNVAFESNLGNLNLITSVYGKTRLVPRVGAGIQFSNKVFGIRSKIMWENTARLKFDVATLNTIFPKVTDQPFKSSYSWSLGIFFKW